MIELKENHLKMLLGKAENLIVTSAEKEMVVREISKANLSDIRECMNNKKLKKFQKELSDIYVSRMHSAIISLSRYSLENLLQKYHAREGNQEVLIRAIIVKIEKNNNRVELIRLANKYNIPGIQEKIVERIRRV